MVSAAKECACCGLISWRQSPVGKLFEVVTLSGVVQIQFGITDQHWVVVLVQVTACKGIANSNLVMVSDFEQNRASGA